MKSVWLAPNSTILLESKNCRQLVVFLLALIQLACSRENGDVSCLLVFCDLRVTVELTSVFSVIWQEWVSVCQLSVAVV